MLLVYSYAFSQNTTGYGFITTKSFLGKLLTMIYAIFAIPLSTATIIFCGRVIMDAFKLTIIIFEQRVLKRQEIIYFKRKIIFFQVLFTCFVFSFYTWFFRWITGYDKLSFFDSFYFTFTTVSTIGFGDILVTPDYIQLEMWIQIIINLAVYVLFFATISMVSSLISAITDLQTELSFKKRAGKTDEAVVARTNEKTKKHCTELQINSA